MMAVGEWLGAHFDGNRCKPRKSHFTCVMLKKAHFLRAARANRVSLTLDAPIAKRLTPCFTP